jgi:hypothetical protein
MYGLRNMAEVTLHLAEQRYTAVRLLAECPGIGDIERFASM